MGWKFYVKEDPKTCIGNLWLTSNGKTLQAKCTIAEHKELSKNKKSHTSCKILLNLNGDLDGTAATLAKWIISGQGSSSADHMLAAEAIRRERTANDTAQK